MEVDRFKWEALKINFADLQKGEVWETPYELCSFGTGKNESVTCKVEEFVDSFSLFVGAVPDVEWYGKMIIIDELTVILKETAVTYLKVLFHHSGLMRKSMKILSKGGHLPVRK